MINGIFKAWQWAYKGRGPGLMCMYGGTTSNKIVRDNTGGSQVQAMIPKGPDYDQLPYCVVSDYMR